MGQRPAIPLTVIGGYLGAGKTTLLNRLLREPGGRRLGVVVNDFGDVGIDAALLASATGDEGIVSLPNGCVCCSLADGLATALDQLADRAANGLVDHILIEASGVADPAVVAHWATVPPFWPGGVIVLAAADSIGRQTNDRYVGGEVTRQLAGADLLVLTKTDRCRDDEVAASRALLGRWSGAPVVTADHGDLPVTLVLGAGPRVHTDIETPGDAADTPVDDHGGRYRTTTWTAGTPISRDELDQLVHGLGSDVLRAKGLVALDDGSAVEVQIVGRTVDVRPYAGTVDRSSLVTIGLASG